MKSIVKESFKIKYDFTASVPFKIDNYLYFLNHYKSCWIIKLFQQNVKKNFLLHYDPVSKIQKASLKSVKKYRVFWF